MLVDGGCRSHRLRFILRRDFLLLATVTGVSLEGINGPLLQVQNSSSMRMAMEKKVSPLSILPSHKRKT